MVDGQELFPNIFASSLIALGEHPEEVLDADPGIQIKQHDGCVK